MKKSVFILFGLVAASSAGRFNENFLPNNKEDIANVRKISYRVKEAARTLFAPSNDISIVSPNRTHHHPDIVDEILRESFANRIAKIFTKFPIEPKDKSRLFARESSFVVIDTIGNIRRLMKDSSVSRWREYIIVIDASFLWLSKFADHLWNLGFVRVAFVCMRSNGTGTFLRAIQNPSARGTKPSLKAFHIRNENLTLALSSPEMMRQVTSTVHPFSSMLQTPTNGTFKFAKLTEGTEDTSHFNNTKGYVKISFGMEVMKMFANKYNLELMEYTWQDEDNSTWMDARDRCVAGEFDYFYDRELPSEENCCEEVEPIAWYTYEHLVFVDSLRSSYHPLKRLFLAYHRSAWLCIFGLIGAFALFARTMENLWRRRLVRERVTALEIWSIFMGQSLPVLPIKFGLRFIFGMWILYSLNINLLYTARFSSALTATDHSELLRTFRDILNSGRPICSSNKTIKLLNYTNNPVLISLRDRLEPTVSTVIIGKIFNDNYIGSRHMRHIRTHNWNNRANDSLRLYTISEATIVNYPSSFFAKKSHPFNTDMRKMLSMARDSGIFAYMYEKRDGTLGKTRIEAPLASADEPFLVMKHLQVMFKILIVVQLISGMIFLIELYMCKK